MVNDIVKLRKSLYSKMLQRAYDFNKKISLHVSKILAGQVAVCLQFLSLIGMIIGIFIIFPLLMSISLEHVLLP